MLEARNFCLHLIYGCNNLLHEPHSWKNTSVCYKKTKLNIEWRILSRQLNLNVLLFNSFSELTKQYNIDDIEIHERIRA